MPELAVDGELQFDAAVAPEVAQVKCKGSKVAGQAKSLAFGSDLLRVRFGWDSMPIFPSSQLRRETRVLAFLADGQRQLVIMDEGAWRSCSSR